MNYKVIKILTAPHQPIKSQSNEELLNYHLNDHEFKEYKLHSVVPVQRAGETMEFMVIFEKENEKTSVYEERGLRSL